MKKEIFLSVLSLMLTACGGISYMGIETRNPGEVTFPKDVRKVLVVNNALAQSDDSGYTYSLLGVVQDTARAKVDSALFDLCSAAGMSILDASFFEDVLLFHDPLRTESSGLSDLKLTHQQVKELCHSNGADAIISLDKMFFDMKRNDENLGAGYLSGNILIKMKGIMRAYIPDRVQPLASILIEDSVRFEQAAENLKILNYYMPTATEALRFAASSLGPKVAEYFVPHWSEESRWYYNNSNSRWKEASAYAAAGKWKAASDIWEHLYNKVSSKSKQAQIASNIALCKEMNTDLESAYDWAQKAYSSFLEIESSKGENTQLLKAYSEVLKKRILADKKLNIQIGSN